LSPVAPATGVPGGSVQFKVDGVATGTPASVNGGIATISASTLAHGYRSITAQYLGDTNFNGSSGALSVNELINTAPSAGPLSMTAVKNQTTNLALTTLLNKCGDFDGDVLSIASVSPASAQGGAVSLSTTVIYVPPTNYTGADSFTYVVADSFGATATNTVTVTVNPANVSRPLVTSITKQADGTMQIEGSGTPSYTYWLQASTNMSAWTLINTNSTDTNGAVTCYDTGATNYANRFYRLQVPQ